MKIDPEIFRIVMIIYIWEPKRNLINTQLPPYKINRMIRNFIGTEKGDNFFSFKSAATSMSLMLPQIIINAEWS